MQKTIIYTVTVYNVGYWFPNNKTGLGKGINCKQCKSAVNVAANKNKQTNTILNYFNRNIVFQ